MKKNNLIIFFAVFCGVSACNGSNSTGNANHAATQTLDTDLRHLIQANGLQADAFANRQVPSIQSPIAQLGMRLFFSKSLGGDRDTACASCHHPLLGGGDTLSLPIGVGAEQPDLLGSGRLHASYSIGYNGGPTIPRNAPTTFNTICWDNHIFHDGRLMSLGKTRDFNGNDGLGIHTPDVSVPEADPLAGSNLIMAQARFPTGSSEEMKGFQHEDKDNQQMRDYLAQRLGGYGEGQGELVDTGYWLRQFQTAFGQSNADAETLITEQNIAFALGEYERSQLFVDTPWSHYVQGEEYAITESAKRGALLFFRPYTLGGANCVMCHQGDFFTDEQFHNLAMPQVGLGKTEEGSGEDFGRYHATANEADRYAFRTPSLLNVTATGPWTHAGAYTSLEAVIRHHLDPETAVHNYDYAQLTQVGIQNLDQLTTNTQKALDKLNADRAAGKPVIQPVSLSDDDIQDLIAFLRSLTDPCVEDSECLAPWIPDPLENADPNGDQLNAMFQDQ